MKAQSEFVIIRGKVSSENTGKAIPNAAVKGFNFSGGTHCNENGNFELKVARQAKLQLNFSHTSYNSSNKELSTIGKDSVWLTIKLFEKTNLLNGVEVFAESKPETLVGKPNYSIYDFDFFEDKFILLTSEKGLDKAQIRLADYKGKITCSLALPGDAGTAKSFFRDYEGYTDLVCSDTVFRLDIMNNDFLLMPVNRSDFERGIKPVVDSANGNFYFSNQWEKYPSFNYYYLRGANTPSLLAGVVNPDLLKIYNMEYYYLRTRDRLEADKIADEFNLDVHIVAAMMSGFTNSMYYEPPYAPLFVLNDTVCIFNHYSDYIYHFNNKNKIIDSVKINYHHPKNWRHWKKQLYVDKIENKVYAFFSKDGHHYLKYINHQTGLEVKTYKLKHHSAEKIKIKEGYVYYVYRPFDSTQEKFLYRERIE